MFCEYFAKTGLERYYFLQHSKSAKNGLNHFIYVKHFQKRPNGSLAVDVRRCKNSVKNIGMNMSIHRLCFNFLLNSEKLNPVWFLNHIVELRHAIFAWGKHIRFQCRVDPIKVVLFLKTKVKMHCNVLRFH